MYDIWKMKAINDLEQYKSKKQALLNIPTEIKELEAKMSSVRSPSADSISVKGGGGDCNKAYLDNICARDELQKNLEAAQRLVNKVSAALSSLSDDEREMLERRYIQRNKRAVKEISADWGVHERTVSRRMDEALFHFQTAMYG